MEAHISYLDKSHLPHKVITDDYTNSSHQELMIFRENVFVVLQPTSYNNQGKISKQGKKTLYICDITKPKCINSQNGQRIKVTEQQFKDRTGTIKVRALEGLCSSIVRNPKISQKEKQKFSKGICKINE